LQIQSLILHSKLHFANRNLSGASEALNRALKICREKKLTALEKIVVTEVSFIEEEFIQLQSLIADQDIGEQLDYIRQSRIDQYLDEILKIRAPVK